MSKITYAKQSISKKDVKAVVRALRSDFLTQGPEIKKFEDALCAYTGAKYAVCVANGTAALHLAALALDLPAGSEGITSPITFLATANCMHYVGATIGFADIEKSTANIDPEKIKVSHRTKVLIPVHFAGQSCDMQQIHEIAKKNNLYVIEDAAHALGSEYKGKKVGCCEYSDMAILSFHPVKNITSAEGGAIMTNNEQFYRKLLELRVCGMTRDPKRLTKEVGPWYYEMHSLGFNYRMTDLQAALGRSQLSRIDLFAKKRREIVSFYHEAFEFDHRFNFLEEKPESKAMWHLCPLLIDFDNMSVTKRQVFERLHQKDVHLQVHYIPVHMQPYYQKFGFEEGDYPQAESYYRKTISLPLYPDLKIRDLKKIIRFIKDSLS